MTDAGRSTGLTVADEQTWLRLRNHVARERGFWFGVLFAGTRLGLDELARRSEGFLAGQGRELTRRIAETPGELLAAIEELVGSTTPPGLVWIQATDSLTTPGVEWTAAWGTALTALNRRRDTMRRELAAGLLLVGPPDVQRLLASRAVDLWSVRSFSGDLAGEPLTDARPARREIVFVDVPIEVSAETAAELRAIDGLLNRGEPEAALDRAVSLLDDDLTVRDRVGLLDAAARAQNALYLHAPAARTLERAVELRTTVDGSDHPETLTSRNNLAYAYWSAGDLTRAITLHEQTLNDRTRILGPDHPDTLTSRNNLAYAYQTAGDLTRAITLHEQNLADAERVLSVGHPLTATIRENLEQARRARGRNLLRRLVGRWYRPRHANRA